MNILVCIKPDQSGTEIGPFESLALEAGLCLKEAWPEAGKEGAAKAQVDVITVGPPEWENFLRRALGMGADNGFHILQSKDKGLSGPDGLVSASVISVLLARAISHPHLTPIYDLILTGVISQDLMAGQTGPMTAEHLQLPLATAVVGMSQGEKGLTASREWEGGMRETLEIPLPALVSIQAGQYVPRYPSLSDMLRAKSKTIQVLTLDDLGGNDPTSNENFLGIAVPERTRAGQVVSGSVPDQVRAFNAFLKERALV